MRARDDLKSTGSARLGELQGVDCQDGRRDHGCQVVQLDALEQQLHTERHHAPHPSERARTSAPGDCLSHSAAACQQLSQGLVAKCMAENMGRWMWVGVRHASSPEMRALECEGPFRGFNAIAGQTLLPQLLVHDRSEEAAYAGSLAPADRTSDKKGAQCCL